jgi:hypothetical protein
MQKPGLQSWWFEKSGRVQPRPILLQGRNQEEHSPVSISFSYVDVPDKTKRRLMKFSE